MYTKALPKKIHRIWFGSCPSVRYLDNILFWARLNRPRYYEAKLWTSRASMKPFEFDTLKSFCLKNNITFVDIEDPAYNDYPNIRIVKTYLALDKMGNAKYCGASDVLRLSVLEKEGGHYFDMDIELLRPLDAGDEFPHFGNYQLIPQRNYGHFELLKKAPDFPIWEGIFEVQFCLMGAVADHPLYKAANELNARLHDSIMKLINEALQDPNVTEQMYTPLIMSLTGQMIYRAATQKEPYYLYDAVYLEKPVFYTDEHGTRKRKESRRITVGSLFLRKLLIRFDSSSGKVPDLPKEIVDKVLRVWRR